MTDHEHQLRELHAMLDAMLKARVDTNIAIISALQSAAQRLSYAASSSNANVMLLACAYVANALRDIARDLQKGLTESAAVDNAPAGCPICGRAETHTHGAES